MIGDACLQAYLYAWNDTNIVGDALFSTDLPVIPELRPTGGLCRLASSSAADARGAVHCVLEFRGVIDWGRPGGACRCAVL